MTKIRDRLYELDILLNYISDTDWLKIPDEIIFYIKENKNSEHTWYYDEDVPFEDQQIHIDTMTLFSYLAYKYIANDFEKEEMKKIFDENSKKQKEPENIENIFKQEIVDEPISKTSFSDTSNQVEESMIVLDDEEVSFFDKIKNFFKKLFSK